MRLMQCSTLCDLLQHKQFEAARPMERMQLMQLEVFLKRLCGAAAGQWAG